MSEPIVPLSDEQRDFVAEHHNLIYSFANQRNIDLEEFYGILAIALCRAAQSYDESKGTFSTYAYIWMDSCLKRYWLTEYRKMRRAPSEPVSLNEYVNSDDGNDTELQDILDDSSITTHLDDTAVIVEEFLKTLTPDQRTIAEGLMSGYSEVAISKNFEHTRAWVNLEKGKILRKYYVYNGRIDLAKGRLKIKDLKAHIINHEKAVSE